VGGDFRQLMDSITSQILTLSDNTRLYPGHGPETTVGWERRTNPFLVGRYGEDSV
jgi:hydroxyacylglutathione hydrolase